MGIIFYITLLNVYLIIFFMKRSTSLLVAKYMIGRTKLKRNDSRKKVLNKNC